jgi:CheY-like chemotaxis protein
VGDALRLGQVLGNLASNAVKFTQSGEVTVLVARDKEEKAYHFTVKDTGIGIPEDRMSRLFLPFSQVDSSLSRRYDGTGLGLAISSRLVELMGGRIWAESKTGVGSQFHFSIPEKGTGTADSSRNQHAGEYSKLEGKKALIAVVKDASREMLANHLRSFAMSAAKPGSDREACQLLEGEKFDAIIVDSDLAKWTILAERIHRQDLQSVPLIEIGFLGEKVAKQAKTRAFLTKPVRETQLGSALLRILGEEEPTAEPLREAALPQVANQDLRILLAEDNPINQKVALAMLKHLGYRADVVKNGKDLLKNLEQKSYDVIFMDIQMPEIDGLEATRLIRSRVPFAQQPRIIAMTAYTLEGDRERCLDAGMDGYISKPVKMEELKAALERVKKLN